MFLRMLPLYSLLILIGICDASEAPRPIRGNIDLLNEEGQAKIKDFRTHTVVTATTNPDLIILHGNTTQKIVALTFSEGPNAETKNLLTVLMANNIKATFFFSGEVIDKNKDFVKTIADNGHSVLSHGWKHVRFPTLSREEILTVIKAGENALQEAIGNHPPLMRTPYGYTTPTTLSVLKELELSTVLWSIDTLDWAPDSTKETIFANVVGTIQPGDIVLFHSRKITVEALPAIIDALKKLDYHFVTIPELLATPS